MLVEPQAFKLRWSIAVHKTKYIHDWTFKSTHIIDYWLFVQKQQHKSNTGCK